MAVLDGLAIGCERHPVAHLRADREGGRPAENPGALPPDTGRTAATVSPADTTGPADPGRRIEVAATHLERVHAKLVRHMVDDALHAKNALRAAKPAKGGVGLRVGAAAVRGDAHIGDVIGVVGVAHGAKRHGLREVPGHPAAHGLVEDDGGDAPLVVEAGAVVDAEIVPLAGKHEIVVAVIDRLRRHPGRPGRQRRDDGRKVALALLAAEGPAHAPCLDGDLVASHPKTVGHLVLDLAWMLRRAVHAKIAVLVGHGKRGLPLKIEMLLPADLDAPGDLPLRHGKRAVGVAALHDGRRAKPGRLAHGRVDVEDGGKRLVLDAGPAKRLARVAHGARHDGEHGLAKIAYDVACEHRVVAMHRAAVVHARNVLVGEHGEHALMRARVVKPHALDARMGVRALADKHDGGVSRRSYVVDIDGTPAHMKMRAVMVARRANAVGHAGTARVGPNTGHGTGHGT